MQRTLAAVLTLLLAGATVVSGTAAPAKRKAPAKAKRAAKPKVTPTPPATAPDPEVARILEAYEAVRPGDDELGLFKLDWAGSLKEAKERAAKENRPIFFVSTTQLERAGDLRGGHC